MRKRGLSTVVTTLIIILLVLVAIGIIWVVIKDVIEEGTGQISLYTKCIETDVRAETVDCTDPANCLVTLTRKGQGDEIGGVMLVFKNDNDASSVKDIQGNIDSLTSVTVTVDSEVSSANKVEATVYFKDEQGNNKLCTQTNSYSF